MTAAEFDQMDGFLAAGRELSLSYVPIQSMEPGPRKYMGVELLYTPDRQSILIFLPLNDTRAETL